MRVIVVGAGCGGIAAAVALRDHDVTLLEAAPALGGTWFHNSYPGAACDVASHFYSFSFAQRRDWSRLCSPQDEILAYLNAVAREQGVADKVVTGARVTKAAWGDGAWTVTTEDGTERTADALVVATGQLHQPAYPRVTGAFGGHSFHSAEWDHGYDLTGKRVAVIGTGASAVQFVPEIAPRVKQLHVFQRTGNWFMPRRNRAYPRLIKAAIMHVPGLQAFRRRFFFQYTESLTLMIRHPRTLGLLGRARSSAFMRWQLRKRPDVRRKVWPDFTFGCKRILFSSHWLPALLRPNVELVTDAVASLTETGVTTADGTHREVDCVIWGTGFRTNDFMLPMEIAGREGTLAEHWAGAPRAHLGITVPGFPNLFLMYGPNTNTSGGSIITFEEAQAGYIAQALRLGAVVEVRREVAEAADRETQAAFAGTAWTRCDSWYRKDGDGRIVANWPHYMRDYLARTAAVDPAEFTVR